MYISSNCRSASSISPGDIFQHIFVLEGSAYFPTFENLLVPEPMYGSIFPILPTNEAEKRGAQTIDGLGMLVYQAAIAFKMWTDEEAPVEEMKRAIKAEFGL